MPVKQMKKIEPGVIWIVILSIIIDDTIGHETQKTRPCVVVANCPEAKMNTIIPLQSNLGTINLPFTHLIKKTQKNKLRNDSVAVIFQIRSLDYVRFLNIVGTMESKDFEKIKILIRDFLKV